MSRDGNGSYSLPEAAFVYDTVIDETAVNSNFSDIASALTASIAKDGQTVPSANLPMGTYKHTGVGNASARDQYAAMGQIQDGGGIWCGTAGGTADALTLTPTPAITAYAAGQRFEFKAGAASNTGAVTFAISGLSTIAGQVNGAACVAGDIAANQWYRITLSDASTAQIERIGGSGTVTSIVAGTGLTGGTITSSGTIAVDVGTTANKIVQLTAAAKLPAVDGSLLTNLPSSGGGALEYVSSATASSSATIDFTGLASGYDYLVAMEHVIPASGSYQRIYGRTGTGATPTWDSTAGRYRTGAFAYMDQSSGYVLTGAYGTNAQFWVSGDNVVAGSGSGLSGDFMIINPGNSSAYKDMTFVGLMDRNGQANVMTPTLVTNRYESNTAITGIQFFAQSGNIQSGTFILYRRKRSA